jgi:hypothetical protein
MSVAQVVPRRVIANGHASYPIIEADFAPMADKTS